MRGGLECSARSGEGQAVLMEVRRSSEEALEGAEGLERRDETVVRSGGCRGRAGGGRPRMVRRGLGKLDGVLAKLGAKLGAAEEL